MDDRDLNIEHLAPSVERFKSSPVKGDFFGGIDPPAHSLFPPDPPSMPRSCIECGKMHDTGWQNMITGAMIERLDKCKNCFMNSLLETCKKHWDTAKIDIPFTQENLDGWNKMRLDAAVTNGLTEEQIKEFITKWLDATKAIDYRTINVESWYQELLEKETKTEDEELIFKVMSETREAYMRIESTLRKFEMPDWIKNKAPMIRTGIRYCDWDSRPIHNWEYSFKHAYFPVHVGDDVINGWRVSTVWLGLDHGMFNNQDPLIFESMIFKEDESLPANEELEFYQERYCYLYEAEQGHKEICQMVREKTAV